MELTSERGVFRNGPAGGRQPDAVHFFHPATSQALVNGVVLAVDRQQRLALPPRLGGDQLPRSDQTFLIGHTDRLSRFTAS